MQRVRIVHPGGPARMAQVWIGDQQLHGVTRVEFGPLDAANDQPVTVKLTLLDPELAVEGVLDGTDPIGGDGGNDVPPGRG